MFESSLSLVVTDWALANNVDKDYHKDWQALKKHFQPMSPASLRKFTM
jgi:hypothetical protein